jgi:Na+/H+ antiporter NhaD/arsenite permease-like protein
MAHAYPEPNPLSMIPFAALLLAVAIAPAIGPKQWHRHHGKICATFAALTISYYIFGLRAGSRVLHAGFEYGSFIVVVAGFFVVAGGIHFQVRGRATPALNTLFLFAGALLGNLLGTVGASMLLIRPWIAVNRKRFAGFHIAFFIFVVSNIGGVLLPIGPPLLLGYLKGVPFLWTAQRCWLPWTVALGALLVVFYFVDRLNYQRPETEPPLSEKWKCSGATNFFVMGVMLACLIIAPAGWRELFIAAIAAAAYWFNPPEVRQRNEFSFAPLKEIAWIFLGIFGTMIPVLDYMERHAGDLGLRSDQQFFWTTGALSAVLDNAPAYLTFLAGALGLHGLRLEDARQVAEFAAQHDHSLMAISLGATLFGALTYIGNGPNLLVKAIADHARVQTPSFFGYIFKYALPILLPILALVSFLFFR